MRFKIDENLHPDIAKLLRAHGHDALTIWDQQMRGQADDRVAEVCRTEQRVLVTLDLDFCDIRHYPPEHYAGLIVLRLFNQEPPSCIERIPVCDSSAGAGTIGRKTMDGG